MSAEFKVFFLFTLVFILGGCSIAEEFNRQQRQSIYSNEYSPIEVAEFINSFFEGYTDEIGSNPDFNGFYCTYALNHDEYNNCLQEHTWVNTFDSEDRNLWQWSGEQSVYIDVDAPMPWSYSNRYDGFTIHTNIPFATFWAALDNISEEYIYGVRLKRPELAPNQPILQVVGWETMFLVVVDANCPISSSELFSSSIKISLVRGIGPGGYYFPVDTEFSEQDINMANDEFCTEQ